MSRAWVAELQLTYTIYWCCIEDGFNHIGMHSCAGWIYNHHIGMSMFVDKVEIEHIFHVAKKRSVGNVVDGRVNFCIFNGFGYVFDADHLAFEAMKLAIVPVPAYRS